MAWIAIAEADLLTAMSGSELTAYRAVALGAGQADPVAPTIAQVADLVRGYVGKVATLGAAGTIPQKLLSAAVDIIAYRIPNRVGRQASDSRKDLENEAIALLKEVAAGKFDIEEPLTATTEESASGGLPSFTARTLEYTSDDEDGM